MNVKRKEFICILILPSFFALFGGGVSTTRKWDVLSMKKSTQTLSSYMKRVKGVGKD